MHCSEREEALELAAKAADLPQHRSEPMSSPDAMSATMRVGPDNYVVRHGMRAGAPCTGGTIVYWKTLNGVEVARSTDVDADRS